MQFYLEKEPKIGMTPASIFSDLLYFNLLIIRNVRLIQKQMRWMVIFSNNKKNKDFDL